MSQRLYLGIDHGSSNTTALAIDESGDVRGSYSVRIPKRTPQTGWVEHEPDEFVRTSWDACHGLLRANNATWHDVAAIGFANQGETSLAWSRETGQAIGSAISWEDRRTARMCQRLADEGVDQLVRERTGLVLDPCFSATKLKWLVDNESAAAVAADKGNLCLGGTDSYVIWSMTGGEQHATDPGTASRTALFHLDRAHWDDDLLRAFGLSAAMLPEVRPSCSDFGTVKLTETRLEVPITADVVDAHAALFAQGCCDTSTAKATYGTGAFIDINTGAAPIKPHGLFPAMIAWDLGSGPQYLLEGGVFSVGSAIDWCVGSGWIPSAAQTSDLARSVADTGGVTVMPSFAGLAAPYWQTSVRASVSGLGLDTTPAHLARALLEGIAFTCGEVIEALSSMMGDCVREVRADGGPTANSFLMQRQADLLGLPIRVSLEPNMTAMGAAQLAGLGAGHFSLADVRAMTAKHTIYEPQMSPAERACHWESWKETVRKAT